ncbi:MAG: DUF86 domain-containing protein [Lentisphaerae bacterium]|nr:DUF86 domain-containing protein [Lentisphaerota bacterium]
MRSGGANYRDEDRLVHMMRTVERIKSKMEGLERSMMREGDDCTELIIYNLQVLGEAANNISDAFCAEHPEIDFAGWAGLRHRLVHDYANIDLDIVWNAISYDLPILEELLKPIVELLPKEPLLPDNMDEFI